MELTRCNPRYVKSRNNSLPRLFDEFFTPFYNEAAYTQPVNKRNLPVDIYDQEGKIVIEAEVPGVHKDDLHVDVKGKQLTIGGERKAEVEVKDEDVFRRERQRGKFERTFSMPFDVKEEQVSASYNNGLLTLEISKPEEQKVKQIKIN